MSNVHRLQPIVLFFSIHNNMSRFLRFFAHWHSLFISWKAIKNAQLQTPSFECRVISVEHAVSYHTLRLKSNIIRGRERIIIVGMDRFVLQHENRLPIWKGGLLWSVAAFRSDAIQTAIV